MREKLIELINVDMSGCDGDYAEELADYLISQGVIVLPCKLGEDIYDITEYVEGREHPEIYSDRIDYVCVFNNNGSIGIETPEGIGIKIEDFGKTIFTDEEQAEKEAERWLELRGEKR